MDHSFVNTPLLQLGPNLYAKAEHTNLTGSIKIRAAQSMLEDAEVRGLLPPSGTIIEPTSGNTGIALAALAQKRGYRCIIVMPDSMSVERQEMIAAYGAEVVLTPGTEGMAGSIVKANELAAAIAGSFIPDQFENPANALAHYRTTGPEIWVQTGGAVDIFVTGVGTGGTITGIGKFLKEQDPTIEIVGMEPASSPLLSQGRAGSHGIQGIGANFVPDVLDRSLLDQVVTVTDEDALSAAKALGVLGIHAGISAGANFHAARLLAEAHPEKTVVTILPDSADRYTSLGL